jgi:hypothetical protein
MTTAQTIQVMVFGHLMEVEFTFVKGAPESQWEPAEGDELDIKSFRLVNAENEDWDGETPEEFMLLDDLKQEVYLTVQDEIC